MFSTTISVEVNPSEHKVISIIVERVNEVYHISTSIDRVRLMLAMPYEQETDRVTMDATLDIVQGYAAAQAKVLELIKFHALSSFDRGYKK